MDKYIVTHNQYGWQTEVNAASNEQAVIVAAYKWDTKNNIHTQRDYTTKKITN